jgi:hypothetical protein
MKLIMKYLKRFLMRPLIENLFNRVMAGCISASVAVGFDLVARDASCLVCYRRFGGEDNPWDMVTRLWVCECALWNSPSNCKPNVRLRCLFAVCVSLPLLAAGLRARGTFCTQLW